MVRQKCSQRLLADSCYYSRNLDLICTFPNSYLDSLIRQSARRMLQKFLGSYILELIYVWPGDFLAVGCTSHNLTFCRKISIIQEEKQFKWLGEKLLHVLLWSNWKVNFRFKLPGIFETETSVPNFTSKYSLVWSCSQKKAGFMGQQLLAW